MLDCQPHIVNFNEAVGLLCLASIYSEISDS